MKIGILTYHDTANYGSFLQCYSLLKLMEERYPNICFEIINYTHSTNERNKFKAPIVLAKSNLRNLPKYISLQYNFAKCVRSLPLSKPHFVSSSYDRIVDYINENYDGVIVGADTVLNASRGFPSIYNLPGVNVKKYYFAASAHGLDYEQIVEEDIKRWKELLDGFDYIGVRDSYTASFIQYIDASIKYHSMVDPTFFYKPITGIDTVKARVLKKYKIDGNKKMIGVMSYSEKAINAIQRVYGKTHIIVSLYRDSKSADVFLYDLKPHEWAVVFSMFEFTFTQFFHGTLFSLLNGTPVICFGRTKLEERKCGKVEDLLHYFGMGQNFLKNFDFDNSDNELKQIITKSIISFDKVFVKKRFDEGKRSMTSFFDIFEQKQLENK